MHNGSTFLDTLIGKPVQIVVLDKDSLPSLILREVSPLGVVAEDHCRPHFYPWNKIIEISPCGLQASGEELAEALALDSEP